MRRIVGVILLIIGIGLIGLSMHIKGRVTEGREQISDAQRKVDTGTGLFNVDPFTKEVGKELARPAQKKIDSASREASEYERLAKWLQIGGIILIVLGTGMILIRKRK